MAMVGSTLQLLGIFVFYHAIWFDGLTYARQIQTENKLAQACQCGIANPLRIVGGNEVDALRKWPWQIGLVKYGYYIICGGTIISDRWILTAAHCIVNQTTCELKNNLDSFRVVVGDHNQLETTDDDKNTKKYSIKNFIRHHNYNCTTCDYDFALLELTEAIPFNNVIRPICLPQGDSKTYEGQNGTSIGWGKVTLNDDDLPSSFLQEIEVPILANDKCGDWDASTITDNMLCAGGEEDKNICIGDSGGPIAVIEKGKYVQVGIASFVDSSGCGQAEYPGVYARVSKVLLWIATTTANGKTCG